MFGNSSQASVPQLVHKPMRRAWFSVVACSAALILSVTICFAMGCSGDTGEKVASKEVSAIGQARAATIDAPGAAGDKLVGVWLGGAYLDENILSQRLKELPQEKADELMRKAQYFAGTIMAIEFRPDGTLENEIEITPPGADMINEVGEGTWKIVEAKDDAFVVEISERNPDGSVATTQKAYKFYEDGNHFAVSIPLGEILGECNPLIIFERQNLAPQTGILAEAPGETQTK